jgi:hypothetical protein
LAQTGPTQLYPGGNNASTVVPTVFFTNNVTFDYTSGSVCLSASSSGCTAPAADDEIRITNLTNGKVFDQVSDTHDFGPVDFSSYLSSGTNQLQVQMIDLILPQRGGSAFWLVPGGGGGGSAPDVRVTIARSGQLYSPDGKGGAIGIEGQSMASVPFHVQVTQNGVPVPGATLQLVRPWSGYAGTTDANGGVDSGLALTPPLTAGDFVVEIQTTVNGVTASSGPVSLVQIAELNNEVLVITKDEENAWGDKVFRYYYDDRTGLGSPDLFFQNTGPFIDVLVALAKTVLCHYACPYAPVAGDRVTITVDQVSAPGMTTAYLARGAVERNGNQSLEQNFWTLQKDNIDNLKLPQRAGLVVALASPATLYVTRPDGLASGYDPTTGQRVFGFPMALSNVGDEPFAAFLPGAVAGVHHIAVVGTAAGSYGLKVYALDDQGLATAPLQGQDVTSVGQVTNYQVGYTTTTHLVADIEPPSLSASVRCARDVMQGTCDNIPDILISGKDDFSGVASLRYRFSPTSPWLTYTAPFSLTATGLSAFEFVGTDGAGNVAAVSASGPIDVERQGLLADSYLSVNYTNGISSDAEAHSNHDGSFVGTTNTTIASVSYAGQLTVTNNTGFNVPPPVQVTQTTAIPNVSEAFYAARCVQLNGPLVIAETAPTYSGLCVVATGPVTLTATSPTGGLSIYTRSWMYDASTNASLSPADTLNGMLFCAAGGFRNFSTAANDTGMICAPGASISGAFTNETLQGRMVGRNVMLDLGSGLTLQQSAGFPAATYQLPLAPMTVPAPPPLPALPCAPTSLFPSNGQVMTRNSFGVGWTAGCRADATRVQVATAPDFSAATIVADVYGLGSSQSLSLPNGAYYIRAASANRAGEVWSAANAFLIQAVAPSPTRTATAPAATPTRTSSAPTPTPTRTPTPTSTPTVLSATPTGTTPAPTSSPTRTPTATPTRTPTGAPATSTPPATAQPLVPPTLISPAEATTASRLQAIFAWKGVPGATGYEFQLATLWSFDSSTLIVDTTTSAAQFSLGQALVSDNRYYWRVRALGSSMPSAWSTTLDFWAPVAPPALMAPANGSLAGTDRPTFSWSASSGAFRYTLQAATDAGFSSPILTTETSTGSFTPATNLASGTTIYWRVRARGVFANYVDWWSPMWSLRTP